jgi:hypothetical protein
MSTAEKSPPVDGDEPIPDGWSDLSEEEREEIHREADEALAAIERGDPGIPMDDVLPRYRKTG